jgi:hypothetical protein
MRNLNLLTNLLKQNWFITAAHRLKLPYEETKNIIEGMHKDILEDKRDLTEYSDELQSIFNLYLDFLEIN